MSDPIFHVPDWVYKGALTLPPSTPGDPPVEGDPATQPTMAGAGAPAMPAEDDDDGDQKIMELEAEVARLKPVARQVADLKLIVQSLVAQTSRFTNLSPDIFLANFKGPASFNEATVSGGNVTDHLSGRNSNGTGSFAGKVTPLGTQVVFGSRDGNSTTYFAASDKAVVVKITGNSTGGGYYTGRTMTGSPTTNSSATLSMPVGLTTPSSDDTVIINPAEDGNATHTLNSGKYFAGVLLGQDASSPKKNIVLLAGQAGSNATTGFSGTKTRVTGVTYNTSTHVLAYQSSTDTYTNGLLTSSATDSDTTIDTAGAC